MKDKLPTVREIAKRAGVSASTVSRVLNSSAPVSSAAKAKVINALQAYEGTQVSGAQTGQTIGIIMPITPATELSNHPSMFTIISSFVEYLSRHGVANTTLVYDDLNNTAEALLRDPKDGYLIIGTSEDQEKDLLEVLGKKEIPSILVNRRVSSDHASCINFEEWNISAEAVEYLIRLGHRKIAFVGGNKNFQNTKRRFSGYERAMRQANLTIAEQYIFFGEYSESFGYQVGAKLFSLEDRPTAGFFASDTIAIGCMRYLTEHGLQLPADFAVIGFGNIEACQYVVPTLSTISQPDRDLGTIAAVTLLQMMNMPVITNQQILLKTNLVIRDSSGGPI